MADAKPTVSALPLSTLPGVNPSDSREIPTLKILAALIAGNVTADEAASELIMLGAPGWFVRSVHSIEEQFRDPDPGYGGPMDHVVRKIGGAA